MTDPRVVFVLPSMHGGGAERVVRAVADELSRQGGVVVEVVSLLDGPGTTRSDAGVAELALGARRVRTAMRQLLRDLRRRRPAAVLSTLKHVSIALGLAHRLLPEGTTHVARVANTYSAELAAMPPWRRTVTSGLIRVSHRAIPRFLCVSEGVERDLTRSFGVDAGRCHVVPNPVDVDRLVALSAEPEPTVAPAVASAAVRFLGVGRLEAQKDFSTLIRAFAAVRAEIDGSLLLVGDGSERALLASLARELDVGDHVQLLGHVENPYPLFRSSDVFVLSSRFEGMPNVLLEALALGLRCVATDCPHGPAEILGPTGLGALVALGDVDGLAAAMVAAARGEHDVEAGPAYVRSRHDPATVAAAYRVALLGAGERRA